MIKPVNGHLIIEPVSHEEFVASQNETYQEIGIVIDYAADLTKTSREGNGITVALPSIKKGDKVYFDAWLAAKYPKEDGKNGEFYWLVKWEDVRAIDSDSLETNDA